MSLSVPPVADYVTQSNSGRFSAMRLPANPVAAATAAEPIPTSIEVKFDLGHQELLFESTNPCPVRNGDWIVVIHSGKSMPQS